MNDEDKKLKNENKLLPASILISAVILAGAWVYTARIKVPDKFPSAKKLADLEKMVLPERGVELPVRWGSLGKQMLDAGVIDQRKFEDLYAQRGGFDEETKKLLIDTDSGQLVVTKENANTLLNLLWALGLANKNDILEEGSMVDKQYGGDPSKFASTGGWTLAVDSPMDHYSRHTLIALTPEQQALVDKVARGIYRPCCGNSTHFPDCNHGMAMLGLLELMASRGVSEGDIYKAALAVNSFWFPDTYLTIAQYLKTKGIAWKDVSPKGILAAEYSSAAGYQQILKQVQPEQRNSGGSCGI